MSCRAAGTRGRPLMMFLHGFPEAAFVWDPFLRRFAAADHGGFRCVAPNLRGVERSSAPPDVAAYRVHELADDILALADTEADDATIDTLVSHDWGGAVGWAIAARHPGRVRRLVIVNSPHPGTFARELRNSPEQRRASAYMNWLAAPGSEAALAENDYARLFGMLAIERGAPPPVWLTDAVRQQYRAVWARGLTGAVNLYRATTLRPDVDCGGPELPPERFRVEVPTSVIWGMDDVALLPGLLAGLDEYVPQLTVRRVPDASHWIVHERPDLVAAEIERFRAR